MCTHVYVRMHVYVCTCIHSYIDASPSCIIWRSPRMHRRGRAGAQGERAGWHTCQGGKLACAREHAIPGPPPAGPSEINDRIRQPLVAECTWRPQPLVPSATVQRRLPVSHAVAEDRCAFPAGGAIKKGKRGWERGGRGGGQPAERRSATSEATSKL